MIPNGVGFAFAAAFVLFILVNSIRILPSTNAASSSAWEAAPDGLRPGVTFVIPGIEKAQRVDLRTITMDVPSQDVITRDNVSVKVNAVVYFRVMNPRKAIVEVEDFGYATSQLSQTMLRSVLGQHELDELLSQRDKLNLKLQADLDRDTDPWGIKVSKVEVKHVDLPVEMQRAMARQAEAEREKRAKIIHASGEFEASAQLALAADASGRTRSPCSCATCRP
jgi:regulator of protease activity HflC (stomatin/prohibitin superfamily)